MAKKKNKQHQIIQTRPNFFTRLKPLHFLIVILLLAAFLRLYNIWYPNGYVFDEVYHAFTAKEYLANHKEAWEWWTTPPPGVAYEWTHPPFAKEVMAASMGILRTEDAWAYRLPGALLGVLSVYLVYLIGKKIFDSEKIALVSAFIFSLDGLNFVQSRTGMNDIYFVSMMLVCVLLFLHKRFFFSAVFLGLALASKWTGLYLWGLIFLLMAFEKEPGKKYPFYFKIPPIKLILFYAIIPPLIYLATYTPFFLFNHNYNQSNWDLFIGLQKQMWWYHTGLKAHHDYESQWWSWPFNLVPVWYFVEYHPATATPPFYLKLFVDPVTHQIAPISNIFASGNQPFFILGFLAVIYSMWQFIKKDSIFVVSFFSLLVLFLLDYVQPYISPGLRSLIGVILILFILFNIVKKGTKDLSIPLLGYFTFLLPWALSPRIMFLYHYSPSVPFMSLLLGSQLVRYSEKAKENKMVLWILLAVIVIGFLIIYPILTGLPITNNLTNLFFLTNKAKNPWDPSSSPFF